MTCPLPNSVPFLSWRYQDVRVRKLTTSQSLCGERVCWQLPGWQAWARLRAKERSAAQACRACSAQLDMHGVVPWDMCVDSTTFLPAGILCGPGVAPASLIVCEAWGARRLSVLHGSCSLLQEVTKNSEASPLSSSFSTAQCTLRSIQLPVGAGGVLAIRRAAFHGNCPSVLKLLHSNMPSPPTLLVSRQRP